MTQVVLRCCTVFVLVQDLSAEVAAALEAPARRNSVLGSVSIREARLAAELSLWKQVGEDL